MEGRAAEYRVEAILRDGRSIYLRALRSDDQDLLLQLFSQLSSRSEGKSQQNGVRGK